MVRGDWKYTRNMIGGRCSFSILCLIVERSEHQRKGQSAIDARNQKLLVAKKIGERTTEQKAELRRGRSGHDLNREHGMIMEWVAHTQKIRHISVKMMQWMIIKMISTHIKGDRIQFHSKMRNKTR
jgi:hypothetical protein